MISEGKKNSEVDFANKAFDRINRRYSGPLFFANIAELTGYEFLFYNRKFHFTIG